MSYFETIESCSYKGSYMPSITFSFCEKIKACPKGSYNLLQARAFGINYADYLRMVRDDFGGKIVGRNNGYLFCIFNEKTKCNKLVAALNKRMQKWEAS